MPLLPFLPLAAGESLMSYVARMARFHAGMAAFRSWLFWIWLANPSCQRRPRPWSASRRSAACLGPDCFAPRSCRPARRP